MSNRLAARTSSLCCASSVLAISLRASSLVPVWVLAMATVASVGLDEEQVQGGDQRERGEAEHLGVAPPHAIGGAQPLGLVVGALQAPDEAPEVLDGLGLGDQRDADRHDGVGAE